MVVILSGYSDSVQGPKRGRWDSIVVCWLSHEGSRQSLRLRFWSYGSSPVLIYLNFNVRAGKKEDIGTNGDDEVSFCRLHQHVEALRWGALSIRHLNRNWFSSLKIQNRDSMLFRSRLFFWNERSFESFVLRFVDDDWTNGIIAGSIPIVICKWTKWND